MGQTWSYYRQAFPPKPAYTEKDYPDMTGKAVIVTGANTGVGKETARLLYLKNAHVWVACRNESKAQTAIDEITQSAPNSRGSLTFLHLDLADLATIKSSASSFLESNTQRGINRLDIVINNAGVMMPAPGTKSAQGYELQLGTNCLGHFLFIKLLTPLLVETARKEKEAGQEGGVRVVWVASSAIDLLSPKNGVPMDDLDWKGEKNMGNSPMKRSLKYGVSKAGNYYHGTEFAKRFMKDGVVSVTLNPGNLSTELTRHVNSPMSYIIEKVLLYPAVYGAYTELFAALSPQITLAKSGCWVVPWGRFTNPRSDLVAGSRDKEEGGTGMARRFWEWSEEQVKPFV